MKLKILASLIFAFVLTIFVFSHLTEQNIVIDAPTGEVIHDSPQIFINQHPKTAGGQFVLNFDWEVKFLSFQDWTLHPSGCIKKIRIDSQELVLTDPPLCQLEQDIPIHNLSIGHHSIEVWGEVKNGSYGAIVTPDSKSLHFVFLEFCLFLSFVFLTFTFLSSSKEDLSWPYQTTLCLFISVGALIQYWALYIWHPPEAFIFSDMNMYASRAEAILHGEFNINHFFQPIGYTLWVAATRYLADGSWWLLKFSHWCFSMACLVLSARISRRLFSETASLIIVFLICFDPQLVSLNAFALSESMYALLVMALVAISLNYYKNPTAKNAFFHGLIFALGFVVKGSLAFYVPLYFIWHYFWNKKLTRNLIFFLLGGALIAVLHGGYAQTFYGEFKLGASAGGLNFVEGKCPAKKNIGPRGEFWLSPLFASIGENQEKKWDVPFDRQDYYWKEGLKCVQDNPTVLLTSFRYIYYLFFSNPLWPSYFSGFHALEIYYWILPLLLMPGFLLGLFYSLKNWRSPMILYSLPFLALFFIAWLFKSELRFRIPFDPIFISLAVAGYVYSLSRWRMTRFKN